MICGICKNELIEKYAISRPFSMSSTDFGKKQFICNLEEENCPCNEMDNHVNFNKIKLEHKLKREHYYFKTHVDKSEFIKEMNAFVEDETELGNTYNLDYSELYEKLSDLHISDTKTSDIRMSHARIFIDAMPTVDKIKNILKYYNDGGECGTEQIYIIIYKWLESMKM